MNSTPWHVDPERDLVLERELDCAPEQIWAAWTQPDLLKRWFTPAPWHTIECRIDPRPGGEFYTLMRSPEGRDFPNHGCLLEVVPYSRLVFTDALTAGFRPAGNAFFSAAILLRATAAGTHYTAVAMHRDAAARRQHEAMGFRDGWSAALEQLLALLRG